MVNNFSIIKNSPTDAKLQENSDTRNAFAAQEFKCETTWQNVRLLKQHYIQAMF